MFKSTVISKQGTEIQFVNRPMRFVKTFGIFHLISPSWDFSSFLLFHDWEKFSSFLLAVSKRIFRKMNLLLYFNFYSFALWLPFPCPGNDQVTESPALDSHVYYLILPTINSFRCYHMQWTTWIECTIRSYMHKHCALEWAQFQFWAVCRVWML